MNYLNICVCVGVATLVTVATYIILDHFSHSRKKKCNLTKSDTVNSENEAAKFEMKKPTNEATGSKIDLPKSDTVNSENETVRSEMKKPPSETTRWKMPSNPAVRSKIKNDISIEKHQKQRPNYFVAIQISNSRIIKAFRKLQRHILDKDPRLREGMKKFTTLHITLMVMYISDAEIARKLSKLLNLIVKKFRQKIVESFLSIFLEQKVLCLALDVLAKIHKEHDNDFSKNPLKLQFKGLGHFNDKVLYAKLSAGESYDRLISLADSVKEHYASASIYSTDSRTKVTPHLTIVSVQDAWKNKVLPKKIDPSLYKAYNDWYFGIQEVQNIQLLSMDDDRDEFGYYIGNTIYFSAFVPKVQRNYRNKMLETEKTKQVLHDHCDEILKSGETKPVEDDYRKKMLETEETKQSIIQMINSLNK